MKKFICKLSKKELEHYYYDKNYTLKQMCDVIGCKNTITASKILNENGIDTNRNAIKKAKTMSYMNDEDFKILLEYLYNVKNESLRKIAEYLGVTQNAVRRYFKKYEIPFKETSYAKSISTTGKRSGNWKGEKCITSHGYVSVYNPDHPHAGKKKRVYEHILVMENHIGRYLEKGEVVHHINGNKSDNRIENLMLLTNSEHVKLHAKLKKEGKI